MEETWYKELKSDKPLFKKMQKSNLTTKFEILKNLFYCWSMVIF